MERARLQTLSEHLATEWFLHKRARRGLQVGDVMLLNDILRDEVRWGTRGELSDYHPDKMTAVFDHKGDASKYRRLVQRAGFVVSEVEETNITEYEGLDYVVEIRDLS